MLPARITLAVCLMVTILGCLTGCGNSASDHPLDADVAHTSLEKALTAWVDGKKPAELKPEIIMGDFAWDSGKKLVSFEILTKDETSDGTNLHVKVKRKFQKDGKESESEVLYIVGTSPVITIFPQ